MHTAKWMLSLSAAALVATSALAEPETYTLDPYHTNIVWHANHFGFSTPSGKFTEVEGTLTLDEEAPQNSMLEVTVDTTSVLTGIDKFDDHLKSADFFNVEKFETATFKSTKVEKTGDKTAKVYGTLTMLGQSHPQVLNVTLNKIAESPISNKKTAGFTATTTIKRSNYGMNYALPGVADEVLVTIESEAVLDE